MSKSCFLMHPRDSISTDMNLLGFNVDNLEESTLESFCPSLPPALLDIQDITKLVRLDVKTKMLFTAHCRESIHSDLTMFGGNVYGIEEETLESFCPVLPPMLLNIKDGIRKCGGGDLMSKQMFLLHPRSTFKEDLEFKIENMSQIDEETLEAFCPLLPPLLETSKDIKNASLIGWLGIIPLKGSQIISDDMATQREFKKRALEKIFMAIRMALDECKGEHLVVGLGSLTAPITNQGQDILKEFSGHPLSVTTGNALTSCITIKSIEAIAEKRGLDLEKETIAILGATGSVGGAVSESMGKLGGKLIISARTENKLINLKDRIIKRWNKPPDLIKISTSVEDLKEAKIVIVTTSSNQVLIKPHHCAKDAIVYDDTVPRNTSEDVTKERPDVLVIDGGVMETPFIDYGKTGIGLQKGRSYACLTETLMFAKEDFRENFTGNVTLEQVMRVSDMLEKYSDEFYLAPFTSFGKEIDLGINTKKTLTSHHGKLCDVMPKHELDDLIAEHKEKLEKGEIF